jgi:dUTP pyrophosphatase
MVVMILWIKKTDKDAIIPKYQSALASGFDLHSLKDYHVPRGVVKPLKTGLAFGIPKGYEVQIRPRSGMSITFPNYIANSPGTIDADYRGEIMILAVNNSLNTPMVIKKGDRIAQAVLAIVPTTLVVECDVLDETERGGNAMGSTGR